MELGIEGGVVLPPVDLQAMPSPVRALQVRSDEGGHGVRESWRERPPILSPWEGGLPGGGGRCEYPPHTPLLRLQFP